MCLIVFAWKAHPNYPLILASNRDEFYHRPTSAAHQWPDHPSIWGGRDNEAKGTWLAVNEQKKLAAVTNYRDLSNINPDATSRGELSVDFLLNENTGADYIHKIDQKADTYNGFNLLTFDDDQAFHYSNYEKQVNELAPGIYGLSNALLDTPWPKVAHVKSMFTALIEKPFQTDDLLKMMQNNTLANDSLLPATGLPYHKEKALSSICIRTEGYGTRCSTIIIKDYYGAMRFAEQSYAVGGREAGLVDFEL
jgi:uncharacterized protein with NRDE domain